VVVLPSITVPRIIKFALKPTVPFVVPKMSDQRNQTHLVGLRLRKNAAPTYIALTQVV
jgi:hypothetical protein